VGIISSGERFRRRLAEGTTAQVVGGRAARKVAGNGEKWVYWVIYQVVLLVMEKCLSNRDKKEDLLPCLARSIIIHSTILSFSKLLLGPYLNGFPVTGDTIVEGPPQIVKGIARISGT
jgi:hypothetical protein